MTVPTNGSIANIEDDTLVIDWENVSLTSGTRGDREFILVFDKSADPKLLTAIDAVYFEGLADWYFNKTYGTYIEREVTKN